MGDDAEGAAGEVVGCYFLGEGGGEEEEGERRFGVGDCGQGGGLGVGVADGVGGAEVVVDLVAEFEGEGEEGWGGVGHLLWRLLGQLVGEMGDPMRLVGDGFSGWYEDLQSCFQGSPALRV